MVTPNTYDPKELENGDFVLFVSQLPSHLHRIAEMDLRHLWKQAQDNARIAANLESRADELAATLKTLHAQGFTLGDLKAFEFQQRGAPVFGYNVPDYVLPEGHRRADWPE